MMTKIIILLDVDETCTISNQIYGKHDGGYGYHDALFIALKQCGLIEVYLFTAYALINISKNLSEEAIGAPSRLKLIQHLARQGITVRGVITSLDLNYRQGIGAYYEQRIKPYEAAVLRGENLYTGILNHGYQAECQMEADLCKQSPIQGKGQLFSYLLEVLERDVENSAVKAFIVVDDTKAYLESVRLANQDQYPLLCIKIFPTATSDFYQNQISTFLRQCHQLEIEKNFNAKFPKALRKEKCFLEQALLELTQPSPLGDRQSIALYGLSEVRYISIDEAYKWLSQDPKGQDIKTNILGNSLVVNIGNIFFKRDPEYPLIEQAVYQLSELLGGEIITPSRLLFLQMPDGLRPLQASLAVEGIGLDDLLRVPTAVGFLQTMLQEKFFTELPRLLDGTYLKDWLVQHPKYSLEMPWDVECGIFLDELLCLPPQQRPIELRISERDRLEKELHEGRALKGKSLLSLLALLERYPKLKDEHVSDLVHLPIVFRLLNELYPKISPEKMLEEILKLPQHIDLISFSRHFILALLTQPQDHKGDNFKVRIAHDSAGRLLPLQIIGIDNDAAMQGAIQALPQGDYEVRIKTVVYALDDLLKKPLSPKVREHLLGLNPKILVLEWLVRMIEYSAQYDALATKYTAIFQQQLHWLQQVPESFISRLVQQLSTIQSFVRHNFYHEALLLKLEPLTGHYYQRLRLLFTNAQSIMLKIYNGRNPPSVREILGEQTLVDIGTPFQKQPKYIIYLAAAKDFIEKEKLLESQAKEKMQVFYCLSRLGKFLKNTTLKAFLLTQEIILTEELFVHVYLKEPEGFLSFLKQNELKIILAVKGIRFRLNEISLFQVMGVPQYSDCLVHGLIAYGAHVQEKRAVDGYTPLHFAARFNYHHLIPVLIRAGAILEALDAQGKSALDKAVEYQHWDSVLVLLLYGAGRYLNLSNGRALLSSPIESIWQQQLLGMNLDLAWQLALEQITQAEPTPEAVCLQGANGMRYLRSEHYQRIFKNTESFPKDNDYGRHAVTSIPCHITPTLQVGIHLKENPELPGREIMVHELAKAVFGWVTPQVALWRFSKQINRLWKKIEVAYPVLASRSIIGDNLRDVLNNHAERLTQLDRQSISEAIVLAMLINPEDGRPDNYLLESFQGKEGLLYRLVSIDNDHSFVRPLKFTNISSEDYTSPSSNLLQVKTILYCLEVMKEPVHETVQQRLLNIEPYVLLKNWLTNLQTQQIQIEGLFKDKFFILKEKNIHLSICFKPSIAIDLYQKLNRLQIALRKNSALPMLDLLRQVIPELGVYYSKVFHQYPTVSERFSTLTEGCFEKIWVKNKPSYTTITTTQQLIEMTVDLEKTEHCWKEEALETPDAALQVLEKAHTQQSMLSTIRDELQQGETKRFSELLNSDYKEWIINGQKDLVPIAFKDMRLSNGAVDLVRQKNVLSALSLISFRCLRLDYCESLMDQELARILHASTALLSLQITGCNRLTHNAFTMIASICPNIEKLNFSELPTLTRISANFYSLRKLVIRDCKALLECHLIAPNLKKLHIQGCGQFLKLSTGSFKLENLKILDAIVLLNKEWQEFSHLKTLHLQYINLRSQKISDEVIEKLCKLLLLNTCLIEKLDLSNNEITVNGISRLAVLLKENPILKSLKLQGNPIGDTGAFKIAELLENNHVLTEIDLGGDHIPNQTQISHLGAEVLARACLKSNIRTLSLWGNKIGDKGFKHMIDMLILNPRLAFLGVGRNQITEAGAQYLAQSLKRLLEMDKKQNRMPLSIDLKFNLMGGEDGSAHVGMNDLIDIIANNNPYLISLNLMNNNLNTDVIENLINAVIKNQTLLYVVLKANDIGSYQDLGKMAFNEWLQETGFFKGIQIVSKYVFDGWHNKVTSPQAEKLQRATIEKLKSIIEGFSRNELEELENIRRFPGKLLSFQGTTRAIEVIAKVFNPEDIYKTIESRISSGSTQTVNKTPLLWQQRKISINTAYQYEDNDIQAILCARLSQLRMEVPEYFIKPIKVLAAIDNILGDQLEARLKQEACGEHPETRVLLIPCNLGNAHWIGMVLEIGGNKQVVRADYIDSLFQKSAPPERFQAQLRNIYSNSIFKSRVLLQQNDNTSCGAYTVENLLLSALHLPLQLPKSSEAIRCLHLKALKEYNPGFYNAFHERQKNNHPTTVSLHEQLGYLKQLETVWFSKQEIGRILKIKQHLSNLPENVRINLREAFQYKPTYRDNHALHLKTIRDAIKQAARDLSIEFQPRLAPLIQLLFEINWQPGTSLVIDEIKFRLEYNEILGITQKELTPEEVICLQRNVEQQIKADEQLALKLQAQFWMIEPQPRYGLTAGVSL